MEITPQGIRKTLSRNDPGTRVVRVRVRTLPRWKRVDASDPDDSDYTDDENEEPESEEPDPMHGLDSEEEESEEEELEGSERKGSVDSRATPITAPPIPEPETKAKRDLREWATKVDHLSTHLPKNPYCLLGLPGIQDETEVRPPRSVPAGPHSLGRHRDL